jgi:large subunit ribosomal protein L9
MNVILLEYIDNLGTVGQTVKVKNGYARNYLLPKKLACLASEQNLNLYRTVIEAKKKKLAKAKIDAESQAQNLASVTLSFVRKSRDQDAKLFGSVTTADIARALEVEGYEIDRKRIALAEPIKKLGEFTAQVKLHPEVTATVNVVVKPEEAAENAV